jgi:hypothetical protein
MVTRVVNSHDVNLTQSFASNAEKESSMQNNLKMMSKKTGGVGLLTLALAVIALFPTAIMIQAQTQAQVKILAGQNQNVPLWTLTIDFRPKHY